MGVVPSRRTLPPLPETVLVPRVELPPVRPPAPSRASRRPWWLPTLGEALVGCLYVACGVVMLLVLAAMLGS